VRRGERSDVNPIAALCCAATLAERKTDLKKTWDIEGEKAPSGGHSADRWFAEDRCIGPTACLCRNFII
jgi:hypothetical protein